jgi:hypothetical protein
MSIGHFVSIGHFMFIGPMKMEQSVPKLQHIKFRHWGITQKKEYNIHNTVEVCDVLLTRLPLVCFISLFSLHFNPNAFLSVLVLFVNLTCQILKTAYCLFFFCTIWFTFS